MKQPGQRFSLAYGICTSALAKRHLLQTKGMVITNQTMQNMMEKDSFKVLRKTIVKQF